MWHGSEMSVEDIQRALLSGVVLLVMACDHAPPKPAADPATATTEQPGEAQQRQAKKPATQASKIGTVGLIRELKDRGMTTQNWAGIIGSIFTNETEKDVIRVRYEVTIFYKDGTQGVVIVDDRPGVQTGQRVRVTGDRIESLEH
jgi:hypothetical protein